MAERGQMVSVPHSHHILSRFLGTLLVNTKLLPQSVDHVIGKGQTHSG